MNKLIFGIVLTVFAVLAVPAAAENVMYLEPSDISCDPEEEVTDIWIYLNATDSVGGFQCHLKYEDDVVDIVNVTSAVEGTNTDWISWNANWNVDSQTGHHYLFITGSLWGGSVAGDRIELGKITLKGLSPGTRPLEFNGWSPGHDPCQITDSTGEILPLSVVNGTFTCGDVQTFTKPLPEGWNLISLPLTPTDSGVDAVLSGVTRNAVKRYDATSKQFEDATTMDPGIGYFVHVTESGGSTWSYQGSPAYTTNPGLKSGLNMIGVPNCTMSVGAAMGSADYRYVARWNADAQEYEVYNPVAPSAFHGFTEMAAGEGYFVSAKSDCALNINCPG